MSTSQYTLLAIDGLDYTDYAVRGITMTLTPIDQAKNVVRSCRGKAIDISVPQFRQYKVTIICNDLEAPRLTDKWPGDQITITCIRGLGAGGSESGDTLTIIALIMDWDTSRVEWDARIAWKLEAEQLEVMEDS